MPDNVPEDVKIDRLNRMIALQNELSLESNRRDIGKTFEVLVEGPSKRNAEEYFPVSYFLNVYIGISRSSFLF